MKFAAISTELLYISSATEMQDMKKDDYNKFIIDHCACIDAKAAESDARGTGGPDIDMFCQTIASLKNTISLNSPFHLGGVISLPTVRYEKVYHTLAVTAATRKEDQETTSKIYDADTLSKRDDFVRTLVLTFFCFIMLKFHSYS